MSSTPKTSLLALLALDAYMRGGTQDNGVLEAIELGERKTIGDWTVSQTSPALLPDSIKTGMVAVAYTNGADTVISYRGTDFVFKDGNGQFSWDFAADVAAGWLPSFETPPNLNTVGP